MDLLTVFVMGLLILVISVCIGIWIQMALEYYCQYRSSLDDDEKVLLLLEDSGYKKQASYLPI